MATDRPPIDAKADRAPTVVKKERKWHPPRMGYYETFDTYSCGCVGRRYNGRKTAGSQWRAVCDAHPEGVPGVRTEHGFGCQCQSCVSAVVG